MRSMKITLLALSAMMSWNDSAHAGREFDRDLRLDLTVRGRNTEADRVAEVTMTPPQQERQPTSDASIEIPEVGTITTNPK